MRARQRVRRRIVAGIAGLLAIGVHRVRALEPKRSVTLIVPSRTGTSSDRLARVVAKELSKILGSPVAVENVAGEGGVPGTNAIATAAKDGTTMGLAISSAIIGGKLLSPNAKFSPVDDFQWLAILGTFPTAMIVPARSPHRSIEAWLAAARDAPQPWVYASLGAGSAGHLAGAYLRVEQGARLLHRPVDSFEERYALLAEGKIDVLFEGAPNALTQGLQSRFRALAVTSPARLPALPDVPCFGELWGRSFVVWIGLVVPRGLDDRAYTRLASAVGVLVSDPQHAEHQRKAGLTFMGLGARASVPFLESEFLRDAKLIAALNEEGQRK